MAQLDVTDIVLDPDFIDRLQCERQTQVIGDDGIATSTTQLITFVGVVTNDSGDKLKRGAAGERVSGNITVHSRTKLIAGADGIPADIVNFNGRRYTVSAVSDYSHFGRGFVAATCDLIPLAG